MRRLPLLASIGLALAASACGNFSNLPLEDLAFVEGLPRPADLALDGPGAEQGEAGQGLGQRKDGLRRCVEGDDDPFCLGQQLVVGVNKLTFELLTVLDVVRSLPPTERGDDHRRWGPWEDGDHPGWQVQVTIRRHREPELSYDWAISYSRIDTPLLDVVTGTFVPGRRGTSKGTGFYVWDARAARAAGLERGGGDDGEPVDRFELTYDLVSEPKVLSGTLVNEAGGTISIEHERFADRSGAWRYRILADMDHVGALDVVEASARWRADRAGRADAAITLGEGGAEGGPFGKSICWDEQLEGTYGYTNIGDGCWMTGCTLGEPGSCVFEPLL